jgi:hypothetical protein
MDMPLEYGSYKTAWERLRRWQDEGYGMRGQNQHTKPKQQ